MLLLLSAFCFVLLFCFAVQGLPCCFVVKYVSRSDSRPEIVLGHGKCPAMCRQGVSHCARGLSQYACAVIK